MYTDDTILIGPRDTDIDKAIKAIKSSGLNLTDEGDIQDFLGVRLKHEDGKLHIHQPVLINQILQDMRLSPENSKSKSTPGDPSQILHACLKDSAHDKSFNYRSIIGKLHYLEKGSRPELAYMVH